MIRFPHASARWWQRSLVFMLLLPLAAVRHSPAVTAAPEVPSGLSAADWQTIQAQLPMAPSAGLSTQQAYLKASNTGANDRFGRSVAVAGDTVVVGAYVEASNATGVNGNQADNTATSAGAAYVFVRSGTTWSQQAYLKASNTGVNDNFGQSVAVAGDTIVVGANAEASNATGVNGNQADNSAGFAGAAYVFANFGPTAVTWALSSLNTSQATVLAGATLEYRLTVGDAEGGAFTATLTLDPRLTLVAAPGMTSQDATLRVSGTLAPGEQRHFRITVRVGSTASGSLASSAIISNGLTSRTLEAPAIPITGVLRQVWLPLLRQ